MLINDINAHITAHKDEILNAVQKVINSGWVVLGPEVKNFESGFAKYIGVQYCVGVANGTDAIEIGLRAAGIVAGDIVGTVANAGMYATTSILAIGAQPIFLDVDPESCNITLQEVKRAVTNGAKAIIATHLYGQAVDEIDLISEYCRIKKVILIEDCAQAHGAKVNDRCVGSFGDIASFSFYPTKNLGALGDGGAIVTNDHHLAERARQLRQYGWTDKYQVEVAGARNSRLDEMQAAILNVFIKYLDQANQRRRDIAERYSSCIKHPSINTPLIQKESHVAHLYVIKSERRDSLRSHLKEKGISSEVHYPIPDHLQPVFAGAFCNIDLPVCEKLSKIILTLPCYPEMTDSQVDQVIEAVNTWQR